MTTLDAPLCICVGVGAICIALSIRLIFVQRREASKQAALRGRADEIERNLNWIDSEIRKFPSRLVELRKDLPRKQFADRVQLFRAAFAQWCDRYAIGQRSDIKDFNSDLAMLLSDAQSIDLPEVPRLRDSFIRTAEAIVAFVVRLTDLNKNGPGKDRSLQQSVSNLAAQAGLELIDPAVGSKLDRTRHEEQISGVERQNGNATVKEVLRRGLLRKSGGSAEGNVLEKAEVRT